MDATRTDGTNSALLTILHTNDFHNRLTEAQAHRLRLLHDSLGGNGLLLDAGDAVASGNITYRPGGEPILQQMSEIGYAAMTVGNREFHFTRTGFLCKLSLASFPVLCANLRLAGRARQSGASAEADTLLEPETSLQIALPVCPYILLTTPSGWRVVVLGLTVPMITERMLSRKVSSYIFDSPLKTATQLIPQLRRKIAPDLLIALTHIGIAQDRALADTVPGIDLIVGGHSHVVLEQGEWVGETLIVQAGARGSHLGRVEARRSTPGGGVQLSATLEPL
jgi:2',3'-cyclic-nucleotide 2'-phosphodiesterase (5'-nucleotidase family)